MRSTLKTSGRAAMRASNSSLSAWKASSMNSMPDIGEYDRPFALRWEGARWPAPPEAAPPGAGASLGLHTLGVPLLLRERLRPGMAGKKTGKHAWRLASRRGGWLRQLEAKNCIRLLLP